MDDAPARNAQAEAIVSLSPGLHKLFRLFRRILGLAFQSLIPHLADDRLRAAVLPETPGIDAPRRRIRPVQPAADRMGREFRPFSDDELSVDEIESIFLWSGERPWPYLD